VVDNVGKPNVVIFKMHDSGKVGVMVGDQEVFVTEEIKAQLHDDYLKLKSDLEKSEREVDNLHEHIRNSSSHLKHLQDIEIRYNIIAGIVRE